MTDKSENYYGYWGKSRTVADTSSIRSYHLLVYHSLDVAAVGQQILKDDPALMQKLFSSVFISENPGAPEWIKGLVSYLLAMHDIGKFSDRFQNLIPELMQHLKGYTCNRNYIVHHTDMGRLFFEQELWKKIWSQNLFLLNEEDDAADWKDVLNTWFYAVTGHHGTPPKKPENPLSTLFEDENSESALSFAEACATLFLKGDEKTPIVFSEPYIEEFRRNSWLLAGLAVMSDWIGSNNEYFTPCSTPMPLEKYLNEYAVPRAEAAIRAFGILPCDISGESGMQALFPEITIPTPLQVFAESFEIPSAPQLFIIEEATGSGKTEAALVLAHRMMEIGLGEGIYLGLPSMATANAMYDRMSRAYQRLYSPDSSPSLVLAHSARHLSEKFRKSIGYDNQPVPEQENQDELNASAQCTIWLSDSRKKALLAQIGVGTIDQALMGVLPFRHQSLRILGLSRNILIVDEVHAYDSYVERVLQNLLKFHAALGGSAILLSATLPKKQRHGYLNAYSNGLGGAAGTIVQSNYPLVTHLTSETEGPSEYPIQRCEMTSRTVEVECTDDRAVVMQYLSDALEEGRCACWVKNTVDDANEAYHTITKQFPDAHVLLFHARFAMGDRIRIEQDVLKTFGKESDVEIRRGKILIATQVVEQSLDLDFDYMVTDLAPMDLIIQRAGRLHRHAGSPKRGVRGAAKLMVFSPKVSKDITETWYKNHFPRAAYVYENSGQLWLTARLLSDRKRITMPDDARLLIEGTYGESAQQEIPKTLLHQVSKLEGKNLADRGIAQLNILKLSEGYKSTPSQWQEDARTPTRLGESRVTVLLLKWDGSNLSFWSSGGDFAEDMSQIGISEKKVSKEYSYSGELAEHLQHFKDGLPGKGRWKILVPLQRMNSVWVGKAHDTNDNEILIEYDATLGLRTIA